MTRDTGRLALMTKPGQLTMAEYEVPDPERDAVRPGSILRANVCGSELHIWNGHHPVKSAADWTRDDRPRPRPR